MRIVPLAVAEQAQRLLRMTRADFVKLPKPIPKGRVGLSHLDSGLGPYDFAQVRAQSEYLRLVSIVEAYIDACSRHLFEIRLANRDDFVRALVGAAQAQSDESWERRKNAFKEYHRVQLTACAKWSDMDAAQVVRNSIAHGLGKLTRRQNPRVLKSKIEGVEVLLRGESLIITEAALDRCANSSVEFIADVDSRIERPIPI